MLIKVGDSGAKGPARSSEDAKGHRIALAGQVDRLLHGEIAT